MKDVHELIRKVTNFFVQAKVATFTMQRIVVSQRIVLSFGIGTHGK